MFFVVVNMYLEDILNYCSDFLNIIIQYKVQSKYPTLLLHMMIMQGPPVGLHGEPGLGVQLRPQQGVHLGHVAAQPEQPAAGSRQTQTYLSSCNISNRHGMG